MTDSGLLSRALPSWIDGFLDYTRGLPSPELFRKWAAIGTVSGALERRVWTVTAERKLHPNLFILLVSPPGRGKSVAIEEVHSLWTQTGLFNVGPSSITRAGLIDQLRAGRRVSVKDNTHSEYHSVLFSSSEFGNLVPSHDLEFLNSLNELYDCGKIFEQRTRGAGSIQISYPHIVILAGTQPKFLASIFPEEAYGMGLMSRLIMVYSAEKHRINLFGTAHKNEILRGELKHDLEIIATMGGEYRWSPEAASEIQEWVDSDCNPHPTHTRLQTYSTRRLAHAIKLCMVCAASRGNTMLIEREDFAMARGLLEEAETVMPEIFKEISASSQAIHIEEAFHYLRISWMRTKKPVPEHHLIHFLSRRVPTNQISFVIDTMIKAQYIEVNTSGLNLPEGYRAFIPLQFDGRDL